MCFALQIYKYSVKLIIGIPTNKGRIGLYLEGRFLYYKTNLPQVLTWKKKKKKFTKVIE